MPQPPNTGAFRFSPSWLVWQHDAEIVDDSEGVTGICTSSVGRRGAGWTRHPMPASSTLLQLPPDEHARAGGRRRKFRNPLSILPLSAMGVRDKHLQTPHPRLGHRHLGGGLRISTPKHPYADGGTLLERMVGDRHLDPAETPADSLHRVAHPRAVRRGEP
jgi:hypothetical protein